MKFKITKGFWANIFSHHIAYLCAFIIGFFIFFPYHLIEIKGKVIDFNLLKDYASMAEFLAFPIGLLSLILIYLTFYSQKKELSETTKTMKQQSFETTFFNLIELKENSLNSLKQTEFPHGVVSNNANRTFQGNEYLTYHYNLFKRSYQEYGKPDVFENFNSNYYKNRIPNQLKKHFKILYTFYHIKIDSNIDFDQGPYSLILNSSLTKEESILFYYYIMDLYPNNIVQDLMKLFWLNNNFEQKDLLDNSHWQVIDLT